MRNYHRGVILAIDSSAGASVAVLDEGEIRAQWRTAETTTHAEVLASAVAETMREAGADGSTLSGVVVGVGPGPFTGLRVGLVLAHSLAEVWDVPLHGVCSLDSLAYRAAKDPDAALAAGEEFLVATDARRREIYWAQYRFLGEGMVELLEGPHVSAAGDAPRCPAVGIGASLYPELLSARSEQSSSWLPDAAELGQLAATAGDAVFRDPLPLYLRESDAKVPAQMRKHQAPA